MTYHNESTPDQPDYRAFLVRLWRVSAGGATTWRASVECPHTGERLGFAGVQDLFDFLSEQTGRGNHTQAEVSAGPGPGERALADVAKEAQKGGDE
jgi:hypothetical protein